MKRGPKRIFAAVILTVLPATFVFVSYLYAPHTPTAVVAPKLLAPTAAVAQKPARSWFDQYAHECASAGYCEGARHYGNGDTYIGEFRGNQKNGKGTYIWEDGRRYEGEFADDKINGRGAYTDSSGMKSVIGVFRNAPVQIEDSSDVGDVGIVPNIRDELFASVWF